MRHSLNTISLAVILGLGIIGITWVHAEETTSSATAAVTPTDNNSTASTNKPIEVIEIPAKKLWVSDKLETPLRSCPGDRCRVVKVVRPGNEMTQIGYTKDGWALVTTGEIKGYLPKRYLQDMPIASQQLVGVQRQSIEALQAQQNLKLEMDALKTRAESAEQELGTVRKQNYELKQELDYIKTVSNQTLSVNEENRHLKTEIEALRQRNGILEQEASDVEGKNQRAWFMIGAGVLFVGWLVGRFARGPRRKGWNQL
jgi:SH3 domain protein